MEFLQLDNRLPDPVRLVEGVAEMHRLGISPTGKFGFHSPNCHGRIVQHHHWDDNWCRYFT
ncbi:fructosamine kinase family protein [Candidatus Bathyarchaeota archaeon]|nr:fructosamine kinase family protein [Candidatus Bathyarchaeota archaeon]